MNFWMRWSYATSFILELTWIVRVLRIFNYAFLGLCSMWFSGRACALKLLWLQLLVCRTNIRLIVPLSSPENKGLRFAVSSQNVLFSFQWTIFVDTITKIEVVAVVQIFSSPILSSRLAYQATFIFWSFLSSSVFTLIILKTFELWGFVRVTIWLNAIQKLNIFNVWHLDGKSYYAI